MKKFIRFLSSGCYLGYLPFIPGTFGCLWGIPLFLLLSQYNKIIIIVVLVVFIFCAIVISQRAEELFGERDSRKIVIDEIVGYLVGMFAIPFKWKYVLGGFILFRLFDILKPIPIRTIDKQLKGGLGIVMDDVVAGIYTNLTIYVLRRLSIL